jgi:hypothetical protein
MTQTTTATATATGTADGEELISHAVHVAYSSGGKWGPTAAQGWRQTHHFVAVRAIGQVLKGEGYLLKTAGPKKIT